MSANAYFCPTCMVNWARYQTDKGTCIDCGTGTIFRQEPVSEDAGTLHRAAITKRDAAERYAAICAERDRCRCANDDCDQPATHNLLCEGCYTAADANVQALADLLDRLDGPSLLSHLEVFADACVTPGDTTPIDSLRVAEACALEDLYDAPAWGEAA